VADFPIDSDFPSKKYKHLDRVRDDLYNLHVYVYHWSTHKISYVYKYCFIVYAYFQIYKNQSYLENARSFFFFYIVYSF